jgi:hypothetical protein
MTRIEKAALTEYVDRLLKMAESLEAEFGFRITRTGGSIGLNSADVGFLIHPVEEKEPDLLDTGHARRFDRMAEMLGLSRHDLGREFKHKGKTYTLIGYDDTRPLPFLVVDAHGIKRGGTNAIVPSIIAARPSA